ncbi:amino acid adenylation domain-containing protein [Pseudoalteromonas sp. OF7H-1]|uniref:amino acid adenylation domain-containing protein n=1 Tax=Pseudoalteromonas sp. OF7H-1 TaxID=2917755 RepID=UPI001EF3DB23|nr:amino acid adenylation domain-containing protein [Pseudoalteromonas sp. OF7H-1]MCG7541368.1 amino acid adenylation domain-containing protein [Pseudoalteromonas sp. OF7H-1]
MIQEYISAYPQGISLSAQQQNQGNSLEPLAFNSTLLRLDFQYSAEQLQARLNEVIDDNIVLSFAFAEVPGFRGLRQLPQEVAKPVVESVTLESSTSINLATLDSLYPLSLNPASGQNLQVIRVAHQDEVYLLVRTHALCVDLASTENIAQRLLAQNVEREESVQYPDFLAWLEELTSSEESLQGKAYWQQYISQLSTAKDHFALPYHKAPEQGTLQRLQCVDDDLPQAVADGITALAQQLEVEAESVYLSLWWLLLARISGQSFITNIGYDPRRMSEDLADALGVYTQALPVQVPVAAMQVLKEWIGQFAFTLEQHNEWAECFESPEGLATSSVMTQFASTLASVEATAVTADNAELSLTIADDRVRLQFNSAAYSHQAATLLLEQFVYLLAQAPQKLATPVSEISLVTPLEQQRFVELNADKGVTASHIFEQLDYFADAKSEHVALVDGAHALSYNQLVTLVNKLAQSLQAQGIKQGDIVLLSLPRGWQQVVTLLAVMRAGAAYCPIDPSWPEARKQRVMEAASATLHINEQNIEQLLLDAQQLELDAGVLPEISLDNTAYVLFTSGSTGVPKGVAIAHRQLAQYCAASSHALGLQENQRFGLTSTVAADIGNTTLFNAFYNGASLVVANEQEMLDGEAFGRFVADQDVDCVKIVPSHLQALLEVVPARLPSKLILGGEAAKPALIQKVHKLAPQAQVFNHYGPTETTVGVMSHQYENNARFDAAVPRLSHVFSGTQIFILDSQDALCATGEQGELCIAGQQLSPGYINVGSDDAFVNNSQWAERLYRTGDLARYLPDGSISLSGRKDDQVQIRGFRVEPNEVAQSISQHLESIDCFVAVQHYGNEAVLVAFLTQYLDKQTTPAELLTGQDNLALQTQLRDVLPDAMVPAFFVSIAELPLLANGKVDRQGLPKIADLTLSTYVAPNSQLETLLASTLAKILEVERVSCDASFFDLGGHSLSAIKFATRIKKLLLLNVEPGVVFDNPSIQSLAQALNNLSGDPSRLEKLALTQIKLATLTPEQQAALREKMGLKAT